MSDLEAYLEWKLNVEHVFSFNEFNEKKKMKLATTEFHIMP